MRPHTPHSLSDMDAHLLKLEQDLIGIAALIDQMPEGSAVLAERYGLLLQELSTIPPLGAAGIAAVLRTFLREIQGNDYHVGVFPRLIRNAMQAAELLAADDFTNMVDIFREEAVTVPVEPPAEVLVISAKAGGVSVDVARRVYTAMVEFFAQRRAPR